MMYDVVLESLNALFIAGIIIYQLGGNRYRGLKNKPGVKLILVGFCLMLFGACLDISDEFPQLNYLMVVGDTPLEAFLEKFVGYALGSLLLLIGFARIIPALGVLGEKQQLIETIVETIPAPTFCKDDKGYYLACNQDFEEFLGFPRAQIIGKTVFDVAPEELALIYQRADQDLLDCGERQSYEAQVSTADGTQKDVLFHKAVFKKEDGSPGGIVGVMIDISERKRVEEGLRRLDQMKSEFIATAAHELRTPLASVQGYAELLQLAENSNDFSEEQQQSFLREVCQASETLSSLIDELLDVGRIEAGYPLPHDIQPRHPEQLLQRVVEASRLQNRSFTIDYSCKLAPTCLVLFDEQRLRQVVENLISNALKYSPDADRIEVVAQVINDCFELSVRDWGIGMSTEQLRQVFDKFYRAAPTNEQTTGLGLGMGIVKSIVEAHQGRIEVESSLGDGTCVRVRLPLSTT